MNNFLNELFCGFRKAHSTQHLLFKLLQASQKELKIRDSSELYSRICQKHMIVYFAIYYLLNLGLTDSHGRSRKTLLMDYLNSRKQRTQVGSSYASGLKLNTEFRKVPYWDPYYSIYL